MDPTIILIVLGLALLVAVIAAVVFQGNAQTERDKATKLAEEKTALEEKLKAAQESGGKPARAAAAAAPAAAAPVAAAVPSALAPAPVRVEVVKDEKLIKDLKERDERLKEREEKLKEVQAQLDKARHESKDAQKQAHDLKGEVKALREKIQGRKDKVSEADPLAMRAELAEAQNRAEEQRSRAERAEREVARLKEEGAAAAPAVAAPVVAAGAGPSPEEVERLQRIHQAELGDVKGQQERLREELRDTRERAKSEVRSIREKAVGEIKDLREKLSRALRDVDRQKRRAENNDKAYRILQLQLDAAMEKLALLDPSFRAPGGFYDPAVEAKLKERAAVERERLEAEREADREAEQQEAAAQALAQAMAKVGGEPSKPEVALPALVGEAVGSQSGLIHLDMDTSLLDEGWSIGGDEPELTLSTPSLKKNDA